MVANKLLTRKSTGLDAIELLRNAVLFFDNRHEDFNTNKSVNQLLAEYINYDSFDPALYPSLINKEETQDSSYLSTEWTQDRRDELQMLEELLVTCIGINKCSNIIENLQGITKLSKSLWNSRLTNHKCSFYQFLISIAK
jgi:hypothetical protein